MFTLNVDYDQLRYNSGYHTPFNSIKLWSDLQQFKYNRQRNLAVSDKMALYHVSATIIITTLGARMEPRIVAMNRRREIQIFAP